MKTMMKLYALTTLCLTALSSSATVYYCKQCDKKFYYVRSLNASGYCADCWCKKHSRAKSTVGKKSRCRNCVAEKMKSDGSARCTICKRTSKEVELLFQTNGTAFPIEFYCIDHFCKVHNMPFKMHEGKPICFGCEVNEIEEELSKANDARKRELEKASETARKAEADLEIALMIYDNANPEKCCEVHKWKDIYAPRFGGDYYTEDARAKYAQNYMKSLELQEKGLLKCTCNENKQYWLACKSKANEAQRIYAEACKQRKEVAAASWKRLKEVEERLEKHLETIKARIEK